VRGRARNRITAVKLSGGARAALYAVLVGTGLRIGELADICVRDLRLDDRIPHIDVPARIDKRRKAARIPLRSDLVELLRARIAGKPPTARVFDVPENLLCRFNADCKRAGIPKHDDRGRTVDIHSLRMTFATWLSAFGVAPRVAQELMRHQNIDMTMGVYTDTGLLDLRGAVETLPSLHRMLHQTDVPEGQRTSTDVNVEGGGKRSGKKPKKPGK
jgi:integrase